MRAHYAVAAIAMLLAFSCAGCNRQSGERRPAQTSTAVPTAKPTVQPTKKPTPKPTPKPSPTLAAACSSSLAQQSASPSDALTMMPELTSGALAQTIDDHNQLAYVVATAEWETDHFRTMHEYYNSADDLNQAYDGELGNDPYPSNDGFTYRGRGYVQLTGKANYARMGRLLNLDLVNVPDLAAGPFVAGEIAAIGMNHGLFTGAKLNDYISGTSVDFPGARTIINDHDQAQTIAGYAGNFSTTLVACGAVGLR